MYKLKLGLTILAATLALAACGETFRAKQLSTTGDLAGDLSNNPKEENPAGDNPIIGQTPLSVDQKFAANYVNDLSQANTTALGQFIKAFTIKKTLASPNVDFVTFEVQIATGCNQNSYTVIRGMTEIENLILKDPGTRISVGRANGFEVHVQCTDRDCNEMAAAIIHTSAGVKRTVLTGLIRSTSYAGASATNHMMVSRGVNESNFVRFNNVVNYFLGCTENNNPDPVDPTDPEFNPFDPVDPTEGFGGEVDPDESGTNNGGVFDPFFSSETL